MDYKPLYHLLFNAITDAVRSLQNGHPEEALSFLIYAQRKAETLYIEGEDPEE